MSDDVKFDPAAEKAMSWYGWGSPVGLGLFVMALAVSAVLLHYAWVMR
jgi:hypothetical protein